MVQFLPTRWDRTNNVLLCRPDMPTTPQRRHGSPKHCSTPKSNKRLRCDLDGEHTPYVCTHLLSKYKDGLFVYSTNLDLSEHGSETLSSWEIDPYVEQR